MIQDIYPSRLLNAFAHGAPTGRELVFAFSGRRFLARADNGKLELPTAAEFWRDGASRTFYPIRLFSIDEKTFYLAFDENGTSEAPELPGYELFDQMQFRTARPLSFRLALATAIHLHVWYETNRFCGRCGSTMSHDEMERMLACPTCGNHVYPRINPAVIVAVRNGDSLLMARYAGPKAYKHRALIAGFCEIGESAEQTVAREVMEEAGVRVKNIRYYKSQPWGIASDLLLGFVCDLDGAADLNPADGELASVEWVPREAIYEEDDQVSLTREMIIAFKDGRL